MKKIALLLTLLLTICSSAFAWHEPDRQELTEIQKKLCGMKLGDNKTSFNLSIHDDGTVFVSSKRFMFMLEKPMLEVDYNDGLKIHIQGENVLSKKEPKEFIDIYVSKSDVMGYRYKCVNVVDLSGYIENGVYYAPR